MTYLILAALLLPLVALAQAPTACPTIIDLLSEPAPTDQVTPFTEVIAEALANK